MITDTRRLSSPRFRKWAMRLGQIVVLGLIAYFWEVAGSRILSLMDASSGFADYVLPIAGIGALIGSIWLIVALMDCSHASSHTSLSRQEKWAQTRRFLFLLLCGFLFVLAGFVPIFLGGITTPNLLRTFSRIFIWSSFGASIVIVAIVGLVTTMLARNRSLFTGLTIALVLPFLITGIIIQAWIQYDAKVTYEEQSDVFASFFTIAPDIVDETFICLITPKPRGGIGVWKISSVTRDWTRSLKFYYDNPSLRGAVVFADRVQSDLRFNQDGVMVGTYKKLIPYDQLLLVQWDGSLGGLQLIETLQLDSGETITDYDPYESVIEDHTAESELRRLIWYGNPLEDYALTPSPPVTLTIDNSSVATP